MRKFFTLLFIITLTISAFGQADTSHYAIIPFDNKVSLILFKNSKPTELFKNNKSSEITKPDIAELEILLALAAKKYELYRDSIFLVQENEYHTKNPDVPGGIIHYSRAKPNFLYDLKNSKRQYIAILNEKGEKEVFVNCFCNDALNQENWKKSLIASPGNGQCYFNLIINLTTKTYYNINEICVII